MQLLLTTKPDNMKKDMNFDYWKLDKIIPESVCDLLISSHTDWIRGGVVNKVDDKKLLVQRQVMRDSDIVWIDNNFWRNSFYKILSDVNITSGWNFDLQGIQVMQLTRYVAPNGHYDYHMDGNGYNTTINSDVGVVRKLSMSCLLNDPSEFEGGQLEFKLSSAPPPNLNMEKGDIVIFPSYYLHRVSPVTKGTRYSLVAWGVGEPLR